jgi:hypothetical protein
VTVDIDVRNALGIGGRALGKRGWIVAPLSQDWNMVVALINTLVCTYESQG